MKAHLKPNHRSEGFTLIEILIVCGILGLLMVAILPNITAIWGKGNEADTQARINLLRQMIEKFAQEHGEYPPSEFDKAFKSAKVKGDGTNSGIECLVIHLHLKSLGANFSLADRREWLKNTDKDDNGAAIPELGTSEKLEVVDAWLNPLAYFRNDSYTKPQEIALYDEDDSGFTVNASAMKDERGVYLNRKSYQILSAGEDGEFGTNDDICYPAFVPK